MNLAASGRLAEVAITVCSTARWIASVRQLPLTLDREPLPQAAHWLAGQTDWLRHHPEGPARFDQLHRAAATVARLVDSPPQRIYLGPCSVPDRHGVDCERDLYARPGAAYATCAGCGIQHEVADRRSWLQKIARGYSYTAADIAAAYAISASTIRTWADRGRVVATGHDRHGRPLYPLGQVLDLAAEAAARRATRHSTRRKATVDA